LPDYAFDTASLNGTYAVTLAGEGGCSSCAGIGLLTFDGSGLVTGGFTESRVGPSFSERTIAVEPYRGRYHVHASGLGMLLRNDSDDIDCYLAIRDVLNGRDGPVAQEFAVIFRALDPGSGSLRTGTGWRRPNSAAFSNASLRGRYSGFAVGRGGQVPVAGFGVLCYDGGGHFTEENVANVQGDTVAVRQFVNGTDQGNYSVDVDGTGTVAGGGVMFVITRASMHEGNARAEEYRFMVRDPVPMNGAHFTGVVRRISD
jgi:hypothetical protein